MRAEPEVRWDRAALAKRLYLGANAAAKLLDSLARAGLAELMQLAELGQSERTRAYRFNPATPELSAMFERLAAHYAADLVGVTDLIHTRADKRAKQFADAFRWRKDT